jgi:tetratricopeptide (TPR) repeat protein
MLALVLLSGCRHQGDLAPAATSVRGPRHVEVDLWRPTPGAEKIYVLADPGDGIERMFLLDTGAGISTLTREVAELVGLEINNRGKSLVGMGGTTPWLEAELPTLKIGGAEITRVQVAVDVAGAPEMVGLVPVAGIIGNNVWSHFQLAIDYPADVLDLHRQGDLSFPPTAQPLFFNGDHLSVGAVLESPKSGDGVWRQAVLLELDTGARGIIVSGGAAPGLEALATQGVEPVFGIGAGDELPVSNFMRETRRFPVVAVETGGLRLEREASAMWINYSQQGSLPHFGPAGMPGLLGHSVLDGNVALIDYSASLFALVPSQRAPRQNDMHVWWLDELESRRGRGTPYQRAQVMAWLDRIDDARALLEAELKRNPDDQPCRVLLSQVLRAGGDIDGANQLLWKVPPAALVEQEVAVAAVNAWWLAGDAAAGLKLAEAIVAAAPGESEAWVALADARAHMRDGPGARAALLEANRLDQSPDGHLLRRAWVSWSEGDVYGALTHSSRLLELYPSGGAAAWVYGLVGGSLPDQAPQLTVALDRAMARTHPQDRSLDFMAAAFGHLQAPARAQALALEGRTRDCARLEEAPSRENCDAWYRAMGGVELDAAASGIDKVVALHPERADFRDTQAMVMEARGDLKGARDAAWTAARLQPDDVYMLLQAARLDAAVATP